MLDHLLDPDDEPEPYEDEVECIFCDTVLDADAEVFIDHTLYQMFGYVFCDEDCYKAYLESK